MRAACSVGRSPASEPSRALLMSEVVAMVSVMGDSLLSIALALPVFQGMEVLIYKVKEETNGTTSELNGATTEQMFALTSKVHLSLHI